MESTHCHSTNIKQVKSLLTGNKITVNLDPHKAFINPAADYQALPNALEEISRRIFLGRKHTTENAKARNIISSHHNANTKEQLAALLDEIWGENYQTYSLLIALWDLGYATVPPSLGAQIKRAVCQKHLPNNWNLLLQGMEIRKLVSKGTERRVLGTIQKFLYVGVGSKELGDISPETVEPVLGFVNGHAKIILRAVYQQQITKYGMDKVNECWGQKEEAACSNRALMPASGLFHKGAAGKKKTDETFSWVKDECPEYESWRKLLAEWGPEVRKGGAIRLGVLLFKYLQEYSITTNPKEYFLKTYIPRKTFREFLDTRHNNAVALSDALSIMWRFSEWVLDTKLSEVEPSTNKRYRSPTHHNPIVKRPKGGAPIQTHRDAIPVKYINEMIRILTENDFAWPKKQRQTQWYNAPENKWEKIWNPTVTIAMLLKLRLPLRTFQIRMLDSGEGDESVYQEGTWKQNTGALAKKGRRMGFLREFKDNLTKTSTTGFFVNTNKTQDAMAKTRGYEIPWQNEAVISEIQYLLAWQKKYNPIQTESKWAMLKDPALKSARSDKELERMGSIFPLFRDIHSQDGIQPITDSSMHSFWKKLLTELQNRVQARGEKLMTGEPIRFIDAITGKPAYDLHSLRVSLITALATEGGVPIQILSKCIAGHSSILMTLYYVKANTPYITEELVKAQKSIDEKEQKNFLKFLSQKNISDTDKRIAINEKDAVKALNSTTSTSTICSDMGVCPVSGALCHIGGPKITNNMTAMDYGPTPGGPRNCVCCRFFITGPAFIGGLVAHFNAISVTLQEKSAELRKFEQGIVDLEDQQVLAERGGNHFQQVHKLDLAYARRDLVLKEVDELATSWHHTFKLIERVKAALKEERAGTKLVLAGGTEDFSYALQAVSNFDLLNSVCQTATVYPGENSPIATLRRGKLLDCLLARNGLPPIFMGLSDEESRKAGNEFSLYLQAKFGNEHANALIEGRRLLSQTEILELPLKSLPLKEIMS